MDVLRQYIRDVLEEKKRQPISQDELYEALFKLIDKCADSQEMRDGVEEILTRSSRPYDEETIDRIVSSFKSDAADFIRSSAHNQVGLIISRAYNAVFNSLFQSIVARHVKTFVENRGWFILTARDIGWTFSPNYTDRVPESPLHAYHITKIENVKKILKTGLIPRSGVQKGTHNARWYPERIYITTSQDDVEDLLYAFNEEGTERYVILDIDLTKMPKGSKYFKDPEMPSSFYSSHRGPGAIWTYSRIPASAISINQASMSTYEDYLDSIETT